MSEHTIGESGDTRVDVQFDELRALDARAVSLSVEVVSRADEPDLRRATPCAGWSLGDLLAHMTAQHLGFAAAAAGHRSERADWTPRPLGPDPFAAYRVAADRVVAAFAEVHAGTELHLPEISADRPFPAAAAIRFHLVDYVAHSWDAARTLGMHLTVDDDLARAALAVALAVPDDPDRRGPGAAFARRLPVPPDADLMARVVASLGRSPAWPEAVAT